MTAGIDDALLLQFDLIRYNMVLLYKAKKILIFNSATVFGSFLSDVSLEYWSIIRSQRHLLTIANSCIFNFVGFCLFKCGPKILMYCSASHLAINFALWQGAPSYKKSHCHQTVFRWSGLCGCFCSILYSWLCSSAKLWVSPFPWLRSNPTHEWSQDALLLKWQRTDGSAQLFPGQAFFRCPKKLERGFLRENDFTPVFSSLSPVPFAVCPWCFS